MNHGLTNIIVIAVENYLESEDFGTVDYAQKDALDLIEAFKELDFDNTFRFTELINEKATLTNIHQSIKKISERAEKDDRIIIYFAGHGFYEENENLLAPVDAHKTNKKDTCISVDTIFGYLKKSASTRKILFFDCCHSGFAAGGTRDAQDSFVMEELIYQFRNEKYVVGFASCENHQKSISHPKLQNGVWTHFLIKALKGEAGKIYTEGLLFSDQLQNYLNKNTSEYVALNTKNKLEQTPVKFGTESNKFIIADLNPIFEEKAKKVTNSDIALLKVSLLGEEKDLVRRLPGFQNGNYKVPKNIAHATKRFVRGLGAKLISDEISELSKKIRANLDYKRTDVRATTDTGGGSIETKHFDYNITVEQSDEEPDKYVLTRTLENLTDQEIASGTALSKIFDSHFDRLSFETDKTINVTELIDRIEDLDDPVITVDYDDADPSTCQIKIKGLDYKIFVDPMSINIVADYQTSPSSLISAFKETRNALQHNPNLKLLE